MHEQELQASAFIQTSREQVWVSHPMGKKPTTTSTGSPGSGLVCHHREEHGHRKEKEQIGKTTSRHRLAWSLGCPRHRDAGPPSRSTALNLSRGTTQATSPAPTKPGGCCAHSRSHSRKQEDRGEPKAARRGSFSRKSSSIRANRGKTLPLKRGILVPFLPYHDIVPLSAGLVQSAFTFGLQTPKCASLRCQLQTQPLTDREGGSAPQQR